ncbi:Nn.00g080100.m01.CDS01 [Neocucurbitaria sp. VM-36]
MGPPHISLEAPYPTARKEPQDQPKVNEEITSISFAVKSLSLNTRSICGAEARFVIGDSQGITAFYSTIGGFVLVDSELYMLTSAHAIVSECRQRIVNKESESEGNRLSGAESSRESDSCSETDSGSDSDFDSSGTKKEFTRKPVLNLVDPGWVDLPSPRVLAYLQQGTTTGDLTFPEMAPEMSDFVLLEPSRDYYRIANAYTVGNNDMTTISGHLPAQGLHAGLVNIIASCDSTALQGYLLEGNSSIILRGVIMRTKKIQVAFTARHGLSGSWVVRDGKLCGVIYAAYARSPYLHMIPAETVFKDIKTMLHKSHVTVATTAEISAILKRRNFGRSEEVDQSRVIAQSGEPKRAHPAQETLMKPYSAISTVEYEQVSRRDTSLMDDLAWGPMSTDSTQPLPSSLFTEEQSGRYSCPSTPELDLTPFHPSSIGRSSKLKRRWRTRFPIFHGFSIKRLFGLSKKGTVGSKGKLLAQPSTAGEPSVPIAYTPKPVVIEQQPSSKSIKPTHVEPDAPDLPSQSTKETPLIISSANSSNDSLLTLRDPPFDLRSHRTPTSSAVSRSPDTITGGIRIEEARSATTRSHDSHLSEDLVSPRSRSSKPDPSSHRNPRLDISSIFDDNDEDEVSARGRLAEEGRSRSRRITAFTTLPHSLPEGLPISPPLRHSSDTADISAYSLRRQLLQQEEVARQERRLRAEIQRLETQRRELERGQSAGALVARPRGDISIGSRVGRGTTPRPIIDLPAVPNHEPGSHLRLGTT